MRFSLKEEFRKHLGRSDFVAEKEPGPEPANGEIRTEEVTTDPRASGRSNIGLEFKEVHVGLPNDGVDGGASAFPSLALSPHLAPALPIYTWPDAFQMPVQHCNTDPIGVAQEHDTTEIAGLSDGLGENRGSIFSQFYDKFAEGGIMYSNANGGTDLYGEFLPECQRFAANDEAQSEATIPPIQPGPPLHHEHLMSQAPECIPVSAMGNFSFQSDDHVDHHLYELYKARQLQDRGEGEDNRHTNGDPALEKPVEAASQVDQEATILCLRPADVSRDDNRLDEEEPCRTGEAAKSGLESDTLPRFDKSDPDRMLDRMYEKESVADESSNDTAHINQGGHRNAEDWKTAAANSVGLNSDDVPHSPPKVSESLPKSDHTILVGNPSGATAGVTGSEFDFNKKTTQSPYEQFSTGEYSELLSVDFDYIWEEVLEWIAEQKKSEQERREKSEAQYLGALLNQLVVEENPLFLTAVLSALVDLMANRDNCTVYKKLNGVLNDPDDSFLNPAYVLTGCSPLLNNSIFLMFPRLLLDYGCGAVVSKVNEALSKSPNTSYPSYPSYDSYDSYQQATPWPRQAKPYHQTWPGPNATLTTNIQDLVEKLESRDLYNRHDGLSLLRQYKDSLGGEWVAIMLLPLLQRSLEKKHSPTVRAVYQSLKIWEDKYASKADASYVDEHEEFAQTSTAPSYPLLKHDPVLHDLVTTLDTGKFPHSSGERRNGEQPKTTDRGLQDGILTQLDMMARSLSREAGARFCPILSAVIKVLSQCSGDVQFQGQIYRVFKAYNAGRHEVLRLRLSSSSNTDCKVFEIPSLLGGGNSVSAIGDYCAKGNFMKEDYAKQLGLHINPRAVSTVVIGSGKRIVTTGTARTSFRFRDEEKEYSLLFHILPSCVHDVILGKAFLKITKTFSNLANKVRRVKERLLKGIPQHHLFYLGEYAPRFQGLINGVPQEALADSGAKILIMDEKYARSKGLPIASGKEHQTRLIFADGSTASTSGMAFGVEWEFGHGGGGERFALDFHILRNAPADVILSDQFLFGTEAFSRYECFLVDEEDDDEDDEAFFFAIDIDETQPGQVRLDMSSLSNKKHAEIVLRGEKEDEIAKLPPEQQADARRREDERRAGWDHNFAALQLCLSTLAQAASTSISSSSSSTSGGPTQPLIHGPTPTAQVTPAASKRSRWLLKLKRKAST